MLPHTIELEAMQQLTGLELRAPSGAEVKGRITGMEIPLGTEVFLHELPAVSFSRTSQTFYSQRTMRPDETQPIGDDGSFHFDGIKLGNYMLVMLLPSPPRCGDELAIPIEPFRVRRAGIDRAFDLAEDQPGRIEGRIRFTKASIPPHRLVVIAQPFNPDPNVRNFVSYNQVGGGPRGFVKPDGSYSIGVAAGHHRLQVVDALTGLPLMTLADPLETRAGRVEEQDLALELVELRVAFEFDPEAQSTPTKEGANEDAVAGAVDGPLQIDEPTGEGSTGEGSTGDAAKEATDPADDKPSDPAADADQAQAAAAPGTMALIDRLEIRFTPFAQDGAGGIKVFGGNENYDQGVGVPIFSTEPITLALPKGSVVLLARNNISYVRTDDQRHNVEPLGRAEVDVDPGQEQLTEVIVKVSGPPEIPEEKDESDEVGSDKKDAGVKSDRK